MGANVSATKFVWPWYELWSLYGTVYQRCKKPPERKHLADKGAYHSHEDTALFRQVENKRDFHKGDYHLAEWNACLPWREEKTVFTNLSENAAQSVVGYLQSRCTLLWIAFQSCRKGGKYGKWGTQGNAVLDKGRIQEIFLWNDGQTCFLLCLWNALLVRHSWGRIISLNRRWFQFW